MLTAGIEFLHVNQMGSFFLFLTRRSSGIAIMSRSLKVISGTLLVLWVEKRLVWFSSPR